MRIQTVERLGSFLAKAFGENIDTGDDLFIVGFFAKFFESLDRDIGITNSAQSIGKPFQVFSYSFEREFFGDLGKVADDAAKPPNCDTHVMNALDTGLAKCGLAI